MVLVINHYTLNTINHIGWYIMTNNNKIVSVNNRLLTDNYNTLSTVETLGGATALDLTYPIRCRDGSIINARLILNKELSVGTNFVFDASVPMSRTDKGKKVGYFVDILRVYQSENSFQVIPLESALQLPKNADFKHKFKDGSEIDIISYFDAVYYLALPDWYDNAANYVKNNRIDSAWLMVVNLAKSLELALYTDNPLEALKQRSKLRNFGELDFVLSLYRSHLQLPNNPAYTAYLGEFVDDYPVSELKKLVSSSKVELPAISENTETKDTSIPEENKTNKTPVTNGRASKSATTKVDNN